MRIELIGIRAMDPHAKALSYRVKNVLQDGEGTEFKGMNCYKTRVYRVKMQKNECSTNY